MVMVLAFYPNGILADGFSQTYLYKVKAPTLHVNHSDATIELVSRTLSVMEDDTLINIRILHHEKYQDTANSLITHRGGRNGIISFQYREEGTQIQQLLSPTVGKNFLILIYPSASIPQFFQMMQRERIASHLAIWLIVLQNEVDLEEVLPGLEGKLEDGTQVVLLVEVSATVCRFFSSQLDFEGRVSNVLQYSSLDSSLLKNANRCGKPWTTCSCTASVEISLASVERKGESYDMGKVRAAAVDRATLR
ncbi:uncharacterized protein [Palaemon carinicauda]|uniref:uncharacterized protein n=1 Tax=Palaemon carinicauda TaxID=392227 RepID=UPI0035B66ED2